MDEIIDREQRGEATPAELHQLSEWRNQSLGNEQEYRRVVRLLSVAGELASVPRREPPSAVELLARRQSLEATPRSRGRWTPWLIAAAAAAGVIGGVALERRIARGPSWGLADVATGAAEMTTVQLRDGSVVRLAPASRLSVAPGDSTRDVTLTGRAFFVVAKMPDHPFVVHTAAGNARVLGTRFELTTHEHDLNLVVVEGRVALSGAGGSVEVHGGEQSGLHDQRTIAPTPVAHAGQLEQWVGKFLVFQSTPLRDAVREIEQMYGIRVVIADSTVGRLTVTATFTDQTSAQVLDAVCSVVNAQCETRRGEVVVSRR